MSHKRQDTFVPAPVWRRHLRKEWRRLHHSRERKAAQRRIERDILDADNQPD